MFVGGGGLTLLNSILQLCLENVILEEYDNDIWHVKKYVNGDIEICGTYIAQQQYPITTPYGQIYRYGSDFGISLPEQLINPQDSQAYVSIMSNGTDFAGKVRLENLEQYSNVKFVWLNPTSYTAGLGARIQFFVKGNGNKDTSPARRGGKGKRMIEKLNQILRGLIERVKDSGWEDLTLSTYNTIWTVNRAARARKIGNLVQLQFIDIRRQER
mgnify:CR=1 FL=1